MMMVTIMSLLIFFTEIFLVIGFLIRRVELNFPFIERFAC